MITHASIGTIDTVHASQYQAEGYLVVRRVFPADQIAELGAEAVRLLQRSDLIDTDNIRCRWQNDVNTGECRFDCFDPVIDLSAVCERTARDPRLLDIVGTLYGEPACLFKDKLIFKSPGTLGYNLHQDYVSWKSFPTSFLTVIVAIDAADADNGATEVFPGYHQQASLTPQDGTYHQLPDDAVDLSKGIVLGLAPGDIAIFSGYTPHRSGANRSAQWRRLLYLSYNARSDGGEQRDQHYAEFRGWLQDRYAEYRQDFDVLPMTTSATASAFEPAEVSAAGGHVRGAWAGWINVVVAAVIMLATLPGRTQGLGLITEPMLRDLQLDRVTYANINLWATLLGAVVCLPIGRLFDRIGLRGATFALIALLGVVVWTMSRLAGGAIMLFLLVLGTRALGQSALSVASITTVGKSFDRRVGVAMGVYSVLLSVLFAVAFVAVGTSVRVSGWRIAWAQVAFGLVLFAAPVVLLLRDRPSHPVSDRGEPGAVDEGLSLAAALRTPTFWVFGGATSLFGLVSSGLGLFNEAVLAERGFDQQIYVRFLAATSIIALAGQMVCGWLTLHWSMQRLLGLAMFIYAAALAALPLLTTLSQLWIFAALIGLSGGMITVLFFAVWRRAFGAAHLGRIQGAAQMLTVLASAIGPLIFAQCAALTGSYTLALWTLAPCVLLLSLAAFRVQMPGPEHAVL